MEKQEINKKVHSLRYRITNYFLLLFIIIGIAWIGFKFLDITDSKYTDNAQVRRSITPVNSRVQGFIKEIRFNDYQHVKKGDTLLIIDNSEYLLHLYQAEANYANAIAGKKIMGSTINTSANNISVSDANILELKVRLEHAAAEFQRYKNLLAKSAVTQDQYDKIKTEYDATNAKYEMLKRQKQSNVSISDEQIKRLGQNDANIKQAKAALDIAELNLSYTVVTAPCNGILGRKDIQLGQLIQPGQSLFSVVDDDEVWVIANYKEKQSKNIAQGNDVEIEVDAIPNIKFKGKVAALSNATGSAFSMIPTNDNSNGNFIKIEQLIPIKIEFTSENKSEDIAKLKSGMNVEARIK